MSKVLHFRIDSPGYNSDAIANAWIENGFEYHCLHWQQYRFNNGIEALRKKMIEMAAELQPEFIFVHVQNPEVLDLDTWEQLQTHGFVINYTFDVRDRERMEWMYRVAAHIGFTFFATEEDVLRCYDRDILNVDSIHSSADMELFKPKIVPNYAFDVVFVGNRYDNSQLDFPLAKERQDMIEFLRKNYGSRFKAYGLGQEGAMITAGAEANVYNYAKIAICQNNYEKQDYTSDRLWRIMASGTFCLCKSFPGIDRVFEKEKHLNWFSNFDEMKTLVDFYLSDDKERKAIADMGSQFVRENHTWTARVRGILKKVGSFRTLV